MKVEISGTGKIVDWAKDIPIPRQGDTMMIDGKVHNVVRLQFNIGSDHCGEPVVTNTVRIYTQPA